MECVGCTVDVSESKLKCEVTLKITAHLTKQLLKPSYFEIFYWKLVKWIKSVHNKFTCFGDTTTYFSKTILLFTIFFPLLCPNNLEDV